MIREAELLKPSDLVVVLNDSFYKTDKGGKEKSMLSIYYGTYNGSNYVDNPDLYFDNTYEDAWLEAYQSKEMVRDIDKSDLVGPNLVISPVLGSIPVTRLSGGVKTLIQIANDPDHVYNASACGDNCASWLLKIGAEKDILVRLGHQMRFREEPFNIRIENTGEIVHNRKQLVTAVISQGLLEDKV